MLLQLTDLELIHGIFTLVLVVTYLLVCLKIALKYLIMTFPFLTFFSSFPSPLEAASMGAV